MNWHNLMNLARRWVATGGPRVTRPRSASPALEELESRHVLSRLGVANGILLSTENLNNFVTGEYLRFLRRGPDPVGLSSFVAQLQSGLAPEAVEAAFVSSSEYIVKHGNDVSLWVRGLYQDLLGRTPSAAEVAFWVSQQQAGVPNFQIAVGFTTSAEREAIVIREDYSTFLGRAPEPAGLAHWLGRFRQGANREGVASEILSSNEDFVKNGNTNVGFIRGAFRDVLQRAPTNSEIDFWLTILNQP
jgi:hypothetical protein